MPELPEVETIVRDLNKEVQGWTFFDVWTDFKKIIKKPKRFLQFKKELKNKKIKKVRRRAKNILFDLSEWKTLLIHQKMTGHLLVGQWQFKNGKWLPPAGPLSEKFNTFIHLLFTFKNTRMLALSDLRKFSKVELWDTKELDGSEYVKKLGPEPLDKNFTFVKFKEIFQNKKDKIKQALMDQKVIAGIGNIYSDEILWEAKINPLRQTTVLTDKELKRVYLAIKRVLRKAIKLKGTSISDFRTISGEKGYYEKERKVYRRENEKCKRCGSKIRRIKMGGRSAHFCPTCQK